VAHATIIAPYKAFSREKLPARIGTHIGLMHVNVTLTGKFANPIQSQSQSRPQPIEANTIQSHPIRQQVGTSAMGEWVVIFDYIGVTGAVVKDFKFKNGKYIYFPFFNLNLLLISSRSQKFTTFSTVTLSLFVGLVILSE